MIRIFFHPAESPDFPRSALLQIRLDNVLDWCKRRDKIISGYTLLLYAGQNLKEDAWMLISRFIKVLKETFEFISEHFSSNVGSQSAESTHLTVITCVFPYQSA